MLKNDTFSTSILGGLGLRFGKVFGRFFGPKMHGDSKNTILAKTLKIVLPSRRNANFQEIEDRKNEQHQAEIDEKSHVFWNFDFRWVLGGFWEAKNLGLETKTAPK